MAAQVGLGTLGLSGKYRPLATASVADTLAAIEAEKIAFIDSASVYKQSGVDVDVLVASSPRFTGVPITYKIGADVTDGDIARLMDEYGQARCLFGDRLSVLMLHRADPALLDRHRHFLDRVAREAPELRLGISSNNPETLRAYAGACRIAVLQCALNLLDLDRNLGLLAVAREYGLTVQARSCLASGLLSGRYRENDAGAFTDSIRSRFASSERGMAIYRDRIRGMQAVEAYYCRLIDDGRYDGSLASFCYAAIAQLPHVDQIIVGGITARQIDENLTMRNLDQDIIEEILTDYVKRWACDAL